MSIRILTGNTLDVLRTLPDDSIHCCVSSPPYFGLRSYLPDGHPDKHLEIGLEPTPAAFVGKLVDVFRDVRRVLRPDGTCWLNMGDSYNAAGRIGQGAREGYKQGSSRASASGADQVRPTDPGLKEKDLLLIPERLAIALQEDGWYIRARIIWAKPNPMPESVTDRPTKSHEHIWLMSKQPRYFYDADAIKEPATFDGPNSPGSIASPYGQGFTRRARSAGNKSHKYVNQYEADDGEQHRTKAGLMKVADTEWLTRNCRDVWTIATAPFAEAHFATFPPDLAERCIKAGCPKGGTVLDPFGGSGTTGLVADRLQRNAILIELNPAYADMARKRVTNDCPLFTEAAE